MGEDDTGRELSWGRVGVGSGFVCMERNGR